MSSNKIENFIKAQTKPYPGAFTIINGKKIIIWDADISDIEKMISKINIEEKDTWEDKIFITLDIDWADDDVLIDSIKLLEKTNIEATWFVTHYTPLLLERIRKYEKFESGYTSKF